MSLEKVVWCLVIIDSLGKISEVLFYPSYLGVHFWDAPKCFSYLG